MYYRDQEHVASIQLGPMLGTLQPVVWGAGPHRLSSCSAKQGPLISASGVQEGPSSPATRGYYGQEQKGGGHSEDLKN